jgi:TonB family protein
VSPLLLLRRPGLIVSLAVHGAAVAAAYLTVVPEPAAPAAGLTAGATFESVLPATAAPLEAPASPDLADALPAAAPEEPAEVVGADAEAPALEAPADADATIRVPADLAARPLPLTRRPSGGGVPASPAPPAAVLLPSPRRAGPSGPSTALPTNAPPAYPESARARGVEGETLLRITVLSDGTVGDVEVVRTSGDAALDAAALSAARSWRFRPALEAGVPVTDVFFKSVRFRLL